MQLTMANVGERINVRTGELIELRLDEIPTTGYRWVLLPTAAVALEGESMTGTAPAPGAGGQRSMLLRVTQPGEHLVRLRCERSWEGAATAVASFECSLVAA